MSETPESLALASDADKASPLRVKTIIDMNKAHADLRFSDVDLSNAMMEQAALFAYYAAALSRATRQREEFERVIDLTAAKLDRKVRERLTAEGVKITEALIEKEIRRHSLMAQLNKAMLEAREVENNVKAIVEAFRHRRDMLVQIGATAREERKGELRITAREAAESAAKAAAVAALSRHAK